MAGLRRRKQGRDEDSLTESLLPEQEEQRQEEEEEQRHTNRYAIIVHPGEFNLQDFIQSVLDWWNRLFGNFLGYATHFWAHQLQGREAAASTLSLLQAERLQALRDRVAEKFDIGNETHQDSLRRLWSLAFSGEPCTALKSSKWKDMGWQGEDPATDFRGAGVYGLDNLIYLAEAHPDTFRRLLDKSEGVRAQWEYPFAVAGLNITFMLSELLDLHRAPVAAAGSDVPPRTAAGRAFAHLMSDSDVAFEELYCATFCLLDNTWLEMRASYMEFNTVIKRVKNEVERALVSRPEDLPVLRRKLLGDAWIADLS